MIGLSKRSRDGVGMQITTGLSMDKTDNISISNKAEVWRLGIEIRLAAVRMEVPIIVGILVMIASNLLLARSFRVCLNMRMQETTTITHVLDSDT